MAARQKEPVKTKNGDLGRNKRTCAAELTTFPPGARAVASSSSSSSAETPKGFRFFVEFEDMGAMLHDNLENGHREPRKLVHDMHTLAFFLSTTGVASIPGVYFKVASDELISCTTQGEANSFLHLSLHHRLWPDGRRHQRTYAAARQVCL